MLYYALWGASVIKKVNDASFVRDTDAVVENEFNEKKNHLHTTRNIHTGDFLRCSYEFICAKNKLAVVRNEQKKSHTTTTATSTKKQKQADREE